MNSAYLSLFLSHPLFSSSLSVKNMLGSRLLKKLTNYMKDNFWETRVGESFYFEVIIGGGGVINGNTRMNVTKGEKEIEKKEIPR